MTRLARLLLVVLGLLSAGWLAACASSEHESETEQAVLGVFDVRAAKIVAPPTFTPPSGSYSTPKNVVLASATANATIHYTLDGSNPTTASPVYQLPLLVTTNTTIKAIATKGGQSPSPVSVAVYTIAPQPVAPVVMNPTSGQYFGALDVALSTATPGATIFFTTDGTIPTTSSQVYVSSIHLDVGQTTLNAFAFVSGRPPSPVTTSTYVITPLTVAPVVMSPPGGQYATPIDVALSTATPGATIFFTTDGTIPTTSSQVYVSPIRVGSGQTTIKAMGFAFGLDPSPVTTSTYVVTP